MKRKTPKRKTKSRKKASSPATRRSGPPPRPKKEETVSKSKGAVRRAAMPVSNGIRLTMPEKIRRASAITLDLICRHGARQAVTIAKMVLKRTTATYNKQQDADKKLRKTSKDV
ncbi:MAG TPA: hypothetical protein VMW36_04925 [Patescibacteria group bacterium]|nr:hypothetical protein [Patescibacteria group bacterium]